MVHKVKKLSRAYLLAQVIIPSKFDDRVQVSFLFLFSSLLLLGFLSLQDNQM